MLVTALLVHNEADRYLRRVLERCAEFSDQILVLDDRSSDDTAKIAQGCGAIVQGRSVLRGPAWGKESPARAELWDLGSKYAEDGWLLICDADMLLYGNPRPLCYSWDCNTWAWPLFDCWDTEQQARVDGPWSAGPLVARPWLFCPSRVPAGWQPQWSGRGIHSGHCPSNWPAIAATAPDEYFWLHLGWLQQTHREEKYRRYMAVADQLTDFERQHVDSIVAST